MRRFLLGRKPTLLGRLRCWMGCGRAPGRDGAPALSVPTWDAAAAEPSRLTAERTQRRSGVCGNPGPLVSLGLLDYCERQDLLPG